MIGFNLSEEMEIKLNKRKMIHVTQPQEFESFGTKTYFVHVKVFLCVAVLYMLACILRLFSFYNF